jgi:hypothetical protein
MVIRQKGDSSNWSPDCADHIYLIFISPYGNVVCIELRFAVIIGCVGRNGQGSSEFFRKRVNVIPHACFYTFWMG